MPLGSQGGGSPRQLERQGLWHVCICVTPGESLHLSELVLYKMGWYHLPPLSLSGRLNGLMPKPQHRGLTNVSPFRH